jgi:hypothetical protein
MKEIVADQNLIAFCGLYCGACGRYLKESCPGCAKNEKAGWCGLRKCCIERNYQSCADCKEFADVMQCKKFNNFFSKIFGLIFRSDRKACIDLIKKSGYNDYAKEMARTKRQSIKR